MLLKLCEIAEDESLKDTIAKTFADNVEKGRGGDLNAVIRAYLSDILHLNDDMVVTRLCKFFTQSILAPLATNLQIGLNNVAPIGDGTKWSIQVSLVPDGFVIRHTKDQKSLKKTDPKNTFEFSWQAEFEIDRQVQNIRLVTGRLVQLHLAPHDDLTPEAIEVRTRELSSLINVTLM